MLTPQEVEEYFNSAGAKAIGARGDWRDARCPFHDDQSRSFCFNVKSGGWKCQTGCGHGGLREMAERSSIPLPTSSKPSPSGPERSYDYQDETGALVFQVLRYRMGDTKTFRQRQPDGAGGWIWKMTGVRVVPYRLPGLLAADPAATVFVTEGEKDADNLRALGLVATTNHGGAGKWRKEHAEYLRGRRVVVLPDNDDPGRAHAEQVAASLQGIAEDTRVLELPGLPPKGDVSDWLEGRAGNSAQELMDLAFQAPTYSAGAQSPLPRKEIDGTNLPEIPSDDSTEDSLALEFTARNADDWRYVAGWGRWYQWDGTCWRAESTLRAFDLARDICREIAAHCDRPNIAAKVSSAATVASVERLAKADRRHAATTEQWDIQPWLLNTPGGVVDLRNGEVKPHIQKEYLTKITTASPGMEWPSWAKFLKDITGGDDELQKYLARIVGYALTGETTEHALFFLYGTGANGKSVFLNTLQAVLGDYAMTAPATTFLETKSDQHPTDLASLRGARMVCSIEIDQGQRWAEAKLKSLTGGDMISARFMRQDFFQYRPQFKLFVAGNHKPSIRGVDEAMRRRLHLVPFTVTIPVDKRDKNLPARLLAERDGILAWAIQGCLEWQRIGLQPPEAVLGATSDYFTAEDTLGRWIEEACRQDPNATATTKVLFSAWKAWAEGSGEFVGSEKRFSTELGARGFRKWIEPGTRHHGFQGISLA